MRRSVSILAIFIFVFCIVASSGGFSGGKISSETVLFELKSEYPSLQISKQGESISRLYGTTFGTGSSPQEVAQSFCERSAAAFGISPEELKPFSLLMDGRHTQPMMFDNQSGKYKFTLVNYSQCKNEIPVFRADLRLLVRNETGYPLVLASSALRNIEGFEIQKDIIADNVLARNSAKSFDPDLKNFSDSRLVIWAGVSDQAITPRLAIEITADNGLEGTEDYKKWLLLIDAVTGEILYSENQILKVNVYGSVLGMATDDYDADICWPEIQTSFPDAGVMIEGGSGAYADSLGNFMIPNGGFSPVVVLSAIRGRWFRVFNLSGDDAVLSMIVTPPGPAIFVHGSNDSSEFYRAQINAYVQANIVRDFTLKYNPAYPGLDQYGFPVKVNLTDGDCTAYYDNTSINFYPSSDRCSNTAFGTVVHHEYTHHLVKLAGSGQGQYGEGMSDVMGVLITDEPGLAYGFFLDCSRAIRNADNDYQYPCDGGYHDCGQLLSGCVWDTRNELYANYPSTYRDILANLAINSILLHTGDLITRDITVDWLTLDDDNGILGDGTPHWDEICVGFGVHNMDCPPLELISFSFPDGLPEILNPFGGTTVRVEVLGNYGAPQPGTGTLHYNNGAGWIDIAMNENSPNIYDAVFPATECGNEVQFYFSALSNDGYLHTSPPTAPEVSYLARSANAMAILYEDDFSSDLGWTGIGGIAEWAIAPATGGAGHDNYGGPDPAIDHSPSADNGVLGNDLSPNDGDYEANIDSTYWITSPVIDCNGHLNPELVFFSYLGVENPLYDHAYLQAFDGASWMTLYENAATVDDSIWNRQHYDISAIAANNPDFRIRFGLGPSDVGWEFCGWNIDDLRVVEYYCQALPSVSIDMIPDNPPIEVPPGGFFTYAGSLANNTNSPSIVDVWIKVDVPNYGLYGPIMQLNDLILQPNQSLTYPGINQNVPLLAPAGQYNYIAYCGQYGDSLSLIDSASFPFVVVGTPISGGSQVWTLPEWRNSDSKLLPMKFELTGNSPNPFNASTTIRYQIPKDCYVRLELFNLLGQKIETLIEGNIPAGEHQIAWDASNYSSGIYFVKLSAGERDFVRRMALIK